MDLRKLLRENMSLEVYDPESRVYYKSLVQEVNQDNIAIGAPMKKTTQFSLEEGDNRIFRFAVKDGIYFFRSRVIGTKVSGNILLYLISLPGELQRRQRRQFFRFNHTMDVCYWILPPGYSGTFNNESLGAPQKGIAVDISGGGLLLVSARRLSPGTKLFLRVFLRSKDLQKEVAVKGEVLRAVSFKLGRSERYRCGIKFLEISERIRDEIISFIFTISRERIR